VRIEELNDTNCKTYLLTVGDEAALVDPVRERLDTYRMLLARRGLELRMVLETHMHADHLMLNNAAKELLGAAVVMHRESPSPLVDRHVGDGDVLTLGGERIEVIYTPGHTPDSVSYRVEGAVLTGDTLMVGGSGRTDFPGADAGQQYDAVFGRLFTLPDATVVWPAHDYHDKRSTTIGEEKRSNARYAGRSRAEYVALMGSLDLPFPERIQQSLQVNQSGFEPEEIHFPLVADVAAMPVVSPDQLAAEREGGSPPLLLDVREPEEFVGELGHIKGALHVPLDVLARRLPKLAGYLGREVVVVCRSGARSATAGAILRQAGFGHVRNLAGGMLEWNARRLPTEH
jgi:glyoxylase-like metal-dependent hydrolase (beta-lactamase superfamily II)/rhodanese-related sulfurtransferase